jgi:tripartite-type tricarboxylate transporter receptor subunit TctC
LMDITKPPVFDPMRRHLLHCASTSTAFTLLPCATAIAQSTLPQPGITQLRILCTAPPGSIPDIIARRFAEQLATNFPQGAIVENKPGAAGQLAIAALKAAPSDGSTMLLGQGALATIYPYLYNKLAYDPERDLQAVSLAGEMTLALAVGPAVPASITRVVDLLNWMRSNPKLASGGSPGLGTLPHLLQAILYQQSNVDWQHVAYPGGPPAIVDLIGGQIATLALPEGLFRQHKEGGKIRVLATSGSTRSQYYADQPTFSELGYKGLEIREWFAFFMPDKTSPSVLATASRLIEAAAARPALISALSDTAITPFASTPAQLRTRIANEQKQWQGHLKNAGIQAS